MPDTGFLGAPGKLVDAQQHGRPVVIVRLYDVVRDKSLVPHLYEPCTRLVEVGAVVMLLARDGAADVEVSHGYSPPLRASRYSHRYP